MKKDKNELMRLQTLIENDRLSTGDSFVELIVSDVEKLLKDYFDFRLAPEISLSKSGDKYKINISVLAIRIKNFNSVPKQVL